MLLQSIILTMEFLFGPVSTCNHSAGLHRPFFHWIWHLIGNVCCSGGGGVEFCSAIPLSYLNRYNMRKTGSWVLDSLLDCDLKYSDQEIILSTSERAFQFILQERLDQCQHCQLRMYVIRWIATVAEEYKTHMNSCTRSAIGQIIFFQVYKFNSKLDFKISSLVFVVSIFKCYRQERIVLSKLANDYKKQKGGIFEFGKNITPSNFTLSTMDISKLEDAPLHN